MRLCNYLNEKRKSQRMIMFHGTSSKFLDSISRNGLQYKGVEKVWDVIDKTDKLNYSKTSLPGIYLTKNFRIADRSAGDASRKFGGNPLYIIVLFQPLSGLPDEDVLRPGIMKSVDKTISNFWGTSSNTYEQLTYVEMALDTDKAKKYSNTFKEELIKDVEMMNDIEINPKAIKDVVLEKAFLSELERRISHDIEDNEMLSLSGFKKAYDLYQKDDVEQVKNSIPSPQETEKSALQSVDNLTRMFKKIRLNREDFMYNLRAEEEIGFKGRNRIISLIEDLREEDDQGRNILKVHYGNVPNDFEEGISTQYKNYKFISS